MDNTAELRQTVKKTLALLLEVTPEAPSQQLRMELHKLLLVLEHQPLQRHLASAELQYRIMDYLIGRPRTPQVAIAAALGVSQKVVNGAVTALKRLKRVTTHDIEVVYRGKKDIRKLLTAV